MRLDENHGADALGGLIEEVLGLLEDPGFGIRLWDGSEFGGATERKFTLVIRDPAAVNLFVESGDPALLAEAYVRGQLDVEGDWEAAVAFCRSLPFVRADGPALPVPESAHSPVEDTRDVRAHYDLSDEFFRLFLDHRMVYSCAYFAEADDTLDKAQERKLDLVCRKLQLQAGEKFLDVGCGWGALLIHAASRFGVQAQGITLSQNQLATTLARAAEAGPGTSVQAELRHYRDLAAGSFDKVASVGMVEHVGEAMLPEYFASLHRALRPGGLLLNHGITVQPQRGPRTGGSFIFRRVFPGAELVEVSVMQRAMEAAGFEILDVHALRPHYERTLREWARRFEARRSEAIAMVGEETVRTWDLYLRGCADAFRTGDIGVYQILARRADGGGAWPLPMKRGW